MSDAVARLNADLEGRYRVLLLATLLILSLGCGGITTTICSNQPDYALALSGRRLVL